MKKIILMIIFSQLFLFKGMAQSKVTRYCTVSVRVISYLKIKTDFSTGEIDSLFAFKDTTIRNELRENIPNIKLLPDLLNFMAAHKWELFTIQPGIWSPYIFKREFEKSELQ